MVLTNLENDQNRYLPDKIQKCIEYLKCNDIVKLYKTGVHYIDGLDVKMNYDYYDTKSKEEGKWESHLKFLDIQVILEGEEVIFVRNINGLEKELENLDNDIIFYKQNEEEHELEVAVPLRKGDVLVLYPEDVHMPGISLNDKMKNRKVVFKVMLSDLQ